MAGTTFVTLSRKDLIAPVLCGAAALLGSGGLLRAEAVETHPAPVLHGPQTTTLSTAALENRLTDPTPFGVDLSGLMIVDSHANGAKARAKSGAGINTALAGATAQGPGLRGLLQGYIGQPLSYKTIGAIETAITKYYRDNGRSLVQVTVPPQEVTSGVLQVNVNTFVLQETAVDGAKGGAQGYLASQIRLRPGQEVNTATLLEDVNWLNLNPFRHVSVVFEPGSVPDSTKLTLQVQSGRPWSGYVGASNSGTDETGKERIFAGFNMSALPWQDHQLSYQMNIAPESLGRADLWDTGRDKGYLSHALSYFVPVTFSNGLRMKATLGLSHISSYSVPDGPITSATTTNGLTAELSFPLPRKPGTWTLVPELFVGFAANTYDRTQYLGGALAFGREKTDLQHLQLGLRSALNGKMFGKSTHGNFEISLTSGHSQTEGAADHSYSYLKASMAQEVAIDKDRAVALRFGLQYSPDELHALEQLSLGGDATVRGYPSNAVPTQSGAWFSIEYRAAPYSVPVGKALGQFRPHVFADFGIADAVTVGGLQTTPVEHLAAVGIGGEFSVGENFVAKLDLAQTLSAAGTTKSGDTSLAVQLTARF